MRSRDLKSKTSHCLPIGVSSEVFSKLIKSTFGADASSLAATLPIASFGNAMFIRQIAVNPLSTNKCVPLIKLASSLARNKAARATSSGSQMRP